MGRAWSSVAVTAMACGLLGCNLLRKHVVADAGSEPEQEAAPSITETPASGTPAAPPASAEPAHRPMGAHCAAGEVAILLPQGEETCVVECKSTTECPPAWTCDAEGVLSHNGRPGGAVHYCRSATHGKLSDGGAPAHDASHSTAAQSDAGPAKKTEPHDAGTKVK